MRSPSLFAKCDFKIKGLSYYNIVTPEYKVRIDIEDSNKNVLASLKMNVEVVK